MIPPLNFSRRTGMLCAAARLSQVYLARNFKRLIAGIIGIAVTLATSRRDQQEQ
jgi:hypothetical protein